MKTRVWIGTREGAGTTHDSGPGHPLAVRLVPRGDAPRLATVTGQSALAEHIQARLDHERTEALRFPTPERFACLAAHLSHDGTPAVLTAGATRVVVHAGDQTIALNREDEAGAFVSDCALTHDGAAHQALWAQRDTRTEAAHVMLHHFQLVGDAARRVGNPIDLTPDLLENRPSP